MAKETTIFAAGCFWGVQFYFDQVPGVLETEVGYIGGKTEQPSYEAVCYEDTGHAEAVRVVFDTEAVTFGTLLKQFFRMHDPTQLNRQGPDVGDQYRSAIFYTSDEQRIEAEKMITDLRMARPIVTVLESAPKFWRAEEYHQKYTLKTGRGMCHIPYNEV